jgi:hypothetical protein
MVAVSLTTKIHTVKVLVLDSIGPNLDTVLDFLKCFPCLMRLDVIVCLHIFLLYMSNQYLMYFWSSQLLCCKPGSNRLYIVSSLHPQTHPTKDIARKYGLLDSVECLELSLKKVVIRNYDGSKRPSVDFARFFVLNTKLLKEMDIEIVNRRNEEWMANQRRQLCVENRASRDARIELKKSTWNWEVLHKCGYPWLVYGRSLWQQVLTWVLQLYMMHIPRLCCSVESSAFCWNGQLRTKPGLRWCCN